MMNKHLLRWKIALILLLQFYNILKIFFVHFRRFDDQEYSRLGGPQGGLGTDHSRPQEGPSDGYMGR
jgi:hypothetical protein